MFATLSLSFLSVCAVCALLRIFTKILLLCFRIFFFLSALVRSFGLFFHTVFFVAVIVVCFLYTSHIRFSFFFSLPFLQYVSFLACSQFIRNKWFEKRISLFLIPAFGFEPLYHIVNTFVHSKQYYRRTHSKHTHTHRHKRDGKPK